MFTMMMMSIIIIIVGFKLNKKNEIKNKPTRWNIRTVRSIETTTTTTTTIRRNNSIIMILRICASRVKFLLLSSLK